MQSGTFTIEANILDPVNRRVGFGKAVVVKGIIQEIIISGEVEAGQPYLLPGFIDAHIHIESSMLTPPAFAAMAVRHGTIATVSDPHEIANVCGIAGVRYMVELGRQSGFKFHFGAPSCVPATPFETSGASLLLSDINELFYEKSVHYLAEMMNYPAVLHRDPLVMDKIELAREHSLRVDGHAPGLRGKDAHLYAAAGITTDHECTDLEEALNKITAGMKIIIREGSAAKNFDALHPLIGSHPAHVMFCSDDKHPDDLVEGHINGLVSRALSHGYPLLDVLQIACVNPVHHYGLTSGLLQVGNTADMILCEDAISFKVISTWIDGVQMYDGTRVRIPNVHIPVLNSFHIDMISPAALSLTLRKIAANVMVAINGSIITGHEQIEMQEGMFESDIDRDILKIAVINRYEYAPPAIALVRGFGLRKGSIASSVAHDSHNVIAVGTDDVSMAMCINEVIRHKGGLCASDGLVTKVLPLPVAGLMSIEDGLMVAQRYSEIDQMARIDLGSTLTAPFMTLSFMALLVIPSLKLSDKGLFDGSRFEFCPLQSHI